MNFYIDGSIVATTGNLYTRDIICLCDSIPIDCEYIKPDDGLWVVTEPTGSMFDTYYVQGGATALGIKVGNIFAFKNIYELTLQEYDENYNVLKSLLEVEHPVNNDILFYQQLFASCFSLLESFLNSTFLRFTCDSEDAYHKIWNNKCLDRCYAIIQNKVVAKGPDCVQKEILFREAVNQIVYHRFDKVHDLFQIAFNMNVQLETLEDRLEKRHDIVHRFGYDKNGNRIIIDHNDVKSLLEEIDAIVKNIAEQMMEISH